VGEWCFVRLRVYIYIYMCVCVCVCVSVWIWCVHVCVRMRIRECGMSFFELRASLSVVQSVPACLSSISLFLESFLRSDFFSITYSTHPHSSIYPHLYTKHGYTTIQMHTFIHTQNKHTYTHTHTHTHTCTHTHTHTHTHTTAHLYVI
jgi:hypothetical protein